MLMVEIAGLDDVQQRLRAVLMQMTQAAPEALYREGNDIMGRSVQLVPVDTGLLRSTSHVERPVVTTLGATVELSYGSHGTAPYAVIVHEDTQMNHPNGGQSHFLSQPFFAAIDGMIDRLAMAIRTGMGG